MMRTKEVTGQFAVFRMADKAFALGVGRIVEILQDQECMLIPNMPDFLRGVIELRGRVIPVMDLRTRFGLKPNPAAKNRVIILKKGRERLGIRVDDVEEILQLENSCISQPPSIFGGIESEYMESIAKTDRRMIVILNVDRLLSAGEMRQVKEALGHDASDRA